MNHSPCSLSHREASYLREHFRYERHEDMQRAGICSDTLRTRTGLLKVLEEIGETLQSPSLLVSASQFSKRYSFMVIAPVLYAMTVYDKGLNAVLENCRIGPSAKPDIWLPRLQLVNDECTAPHRDRKTWRRTILHQVFKNHLSIVNRKLASVASVPEIILWENTAVYVFWLYEQRMRQADTVNTEHVEEDFFDLIFSDDGEIFGKKTNPLKRFYSEEQPEGTRVRQTCCLYFQLPGADFCSTCRRCWRKEPRSSTFTPYEAKRAGGDN